VLFLLFKTGNDRYALDVSRVVEVIPLVQLKRLSGSPAGVAGIFNYRGRFVTAIDLCEMTLHRPAQDRLSTRIIIVKQPVGDADHRLLGLIVEEATGTLRKERSDFVDPTGTAVDVASSAPVLFDAEGAIHLLDETHLLSESLRNQLAHVTD
jgi:chemotaxis-related protein WspB